MEHEITIMVDDERVGVHTELLRENEGRFGVFEGSIRGI